MAVAEKELVPGDPAAVWELAHSFGSMGVALEDVGLGFRGVDDGGWRGAAADAFHASFDQQPKRFLTAADAFMSAAVALDTYASALSWAQRQAREVIALGPNETAPAAARPVLTAAQQVEQTGVLAHGTPEPTPAHRSAAADLLRRARAQLETVGDEAAATLRAVSELAPRPVPPVWPTPAVRPAVVAKLVVAHSKATAQDKASAQDKATAQDEMAVQDRTIAQGETVFPDAVLFPDVAVVRATAAEWRDSLRDDPASWAAGLVGIRRRLRRLGLDQLSPRLKQHLFEGHYMSRTNRDVGYHHREGGVDLGAVRVVRVVAGPSGNGVYRAEIRGPRTEGSPVVKRSTFFPDSWTRGQVLCAIRHAFANRYEYDRAKRRWRGVYNGMHIEGYVEGRLADPRTGPEHPRLYHIKTAYPMRRQAP